MDCRGITVNRYLVDQVRASGKNAREIRELHDEGGRDLIQGPAGA